MGTWSQIILHEHGILTTLQLASALVLLHKKGPKTLAKNYRPISLLIVDVKPLTGILAYRLQKPYHIHGPPRSTGFH